MTAGYIYILTNTAVPNAIKVGKTIDLPRRLKEHNRGSNVIGTWKTALSMEMPEDQLVPTASAVQAADVPNWIGYFYEANVHSEHLCPIYSGLV